MLKVTYSAEVIAQALGISLRSSHRRATREGWKKLRQPIRGGYRYEYLTRLLPDDVRAALAEVEAMKVTADLPVPRDPSPLALPEKHEDKATTLGSLKGWQRKCFEARRGILLLVERLEKEVGLNKAVARVVELAKKGQLPDHIMQLVPVANQRGGKNEKSNRTLSRSSIMRWRRDVRENNLVALAPKSPENNATPAWAPIYVKCYNRPQKPSLQAALDEMLALLPPGIEPPSYGQVWRWHEKRSRLDREKGRRSGSELKALKGFIRRDASNLLPLDVGVCDGHTYKAKVAHPVHGRPFKPEICFLVDWATRTITGWSTGLAESAITVADAIRHSVTIKESKKYGGIPAILYTDKGAGNMATENTDPAYGLMARLGISHEVGIPGNAQGRGIIEIINKTVWIRSARELPTLVGHGMDSLVERKVYLQMNKDIRQGKQPEILPSWNQFLGHIERCVDDYNRRPHSALPKFRDPETGRIRHMSPFESWAMHMAEGWKPAEPLSADETASLFRPRTEVKVVRAEVTLFGNKYYDPALNHYHGQMVIVAYDIHEPQCVQVFDRQERLICTAVFERNKRAVFAVSKVEAAREERAKGRARLKLNQLAEIEEERRGLIEGIIPAPKARIDLDIEARAAEIMALPDPNDTEKKQQRATIIPVFGTMTDKYLWMKANPGHIGNDLEFFDEFFETQVGQIFLKEDGDITLPWRQCAPEKKMAGCATIRPLHNNQI